jgi:predicted permease
MSTLGLVFSALLPVMALIALGYGLKKNAFLTDGQWRGLETFAVYILYPGFLIPQIAKAPLHQASAIPLSLSVIITILVPAIFFMGLWPLLRSRLSFLSAPSFTSVFQGLIRFNSFVAIPVALGLYGSAGLSRMVLALAFMVPLVNMICVVALSLWGDRQNPDGTPAPPLGPYAIAQKVFAHPIVISCFLGLFLNITHIQIPKPVGDILGLIGQGAVPMGLLLAGAGLSLSYAFKRPLLILSVSLYKVVIMPCIALWLCLIFGGDRLSQAAALISTGAPSAAAAYVLARNMGGDAELISGIVAVTTVMCVISLPLLLWLFHLA